MITVVIFKWNDESLRIDIQKGNLFSDTYNFLHRQWLILSNYIPIWTKKKNFK